jgi:hypothetical protein
MAARMDHDGQWARGACPAPAPKYGPGTDMRVDMPRTNLDDPGVGLRDNGRRVLTYADLHTIGGALDTREPGRERSSCTSPATWSASCGRSTG